MLAMQYSFTLPADYDMDIVRRRIAEKGSFTDGFGHLALKAYLIAERNDPEVAAQDNLYAPFYVWENSLGLNNFVCGPGFASVSSAFGRPQVATWVPLASEISRDLTKARFASREVLKIGPGTDLSAFRKRLTKLARDEVEDGVTLSSVVAFDPTCWSAVHFRLLAPTPNVKMANMLFYRVQHVSVSDSTRYR
ncbi:DUF4865 family protein [Oryzifoliimicrobium ureilyticus]|uniref:DUF4865 family protein n=1 Tax=Oryzifoliimicrobium ureilyticus TaxID=3113724 RepID=UPI0030764E38